MFRFLCLIAFLSAFLSRAPAKAGIVAQNAVPMLGEYCDIDYAPPLSIVSNEFTCAPIPASTTSLTIDVKLEISGYTWVENTSTVSWNSSHAWAPWTLGYNTAIRNLTGGYVGGAPTLQAWQTNTSQLGGATYYSVNVGWPGAFDGAADGLGASGRWWQLRGIRVISFTLTGTQLAAWKLASADGRHHFFVDFKGTGGFAGAIPPGAIADADAIEHMHWIRLTAVIP